MRKIAERLIVTLSLAISLCAQQAQQSAVPRQVRVTNVYHPADGSAPAPVESITLSIYGDQVGGNPLWTETQNVQLDTEGHYNVLLGSTLPAGVPGALFASGDPRWLGVRFNRPGETEQPRLQVVSVPYALKAADAETLGGRPASDYLLAPAGSAEETSPAGGTAATSGKSGPALKSPTAQVNSGAANCIGVFVNTTDLNCSVMWQSGSKIGIGTAVPGTGLDLGFGSIRVAGYSAPSSGVGLEMAYIGANSAGYVFAYDRGSSVPKDLLLGGSGAAMTIKAAGNVGIGNSSPSYMLDVAGDINLTGVLRYQNSVALRFQPSSSNIAVGSTAFQSNGSGINNTAFGFSSLLSNSSGNGNTAIGTSALDSNTTGSSSTAVGYSALLNNNSTTGQNTAIGYNALGTDTSGGNNIALGFNAGSSMSGGSGNIYIGSTGSSGDNNVIRIGSGQTSFFTAGIAGANVSGVPVVVNTSTGQLGVASSSRRFKEDIQDMGDASQGLLRLRPVTFRYKQPFEDGSKPLQYGLIAEEVEDVYPELVARSANGQIETVKYQVLAPMLLNEVQRQEARIREQEAEIRALERQITELRTAMAVTGNLR